MSEEFDKEAEREKLREKFAKDEQKRQETQRMSELLLQGATMTNEHCNDCGDPLFRDGGETFCPTCGGAEATEATDTTPRESEQAQRSEQSQRAEPADADTAPAEAAGRASGTEPTPRDGQHGRSEVVQPPGADVAAGDDTAPRPEEQTSVQSAPAATDPRVELRRAVTETARKATAATDPRTATAWLEASKEAAEALAALER